MRPAWPGSALSSKGTSSLEASALSVCLGSSTWAGLDVNSAAKTCWALDANLGEETSSEASLWLRTYSSSGMGKAGDRGTAMARAAKMERRVTASCPNDKISASFAHISKTTKLDILNGAAHLRNRSCSLPKGQSSRRPGRRRWTCPAPPAAGSVLGARRQAAGRR